MGLTFEAERSHAVNPTRLGGRPPPDDDGGVRRFLLIVLTVMACIPAATATAATPDPPATNTTVPAPGTVNTATERPSALPRPNSGQKPRPQAGDRGGALQYATFALMLAGLAFHRVSHRRLQPQGPPASRADQHIDASAWTRPRRRGGPGPCRWLLDDSGGQSGHARCARASVRRLNPLVMGRVRCGPADPAEPAARRCQSSALSGAPPGVNSRVDSPRREGSMASSFPPPSCGLLRGSCALEGEVNPADQRKLRRHC